MASKLVKLKNMLPCFSSNNRSNAIARYVISFCNRFFSKPNLSSPIFKFRFRVNFPNFNNVFFSQFSNACISSFNGAIQRIFCLCSHEKMIPINTWGIIARMANRQSFWNNAIFNFPRDAVGWFGDIFKVNPAISCNIFSSSPYPAIRRFFNIFPKSFFDGFSSSFVRAFTAFLGMKIRFFAKTSWARSLSHIGIIVYIASPVLADQIAINKFRGLNNNENSLIIDNESAADLLNIDVTPGGKSIKKRSGYGLYDALGTGQAVHGGFHFFDSTGNDVQVWGSSTSLYGIVADGTPTRLVSSATLNSTWDCADTQGNAYCVDSNRDALIRTNGATISWNTTVLGTMIEVTPDRAVVAGVSGSPNTLYVSGSNDFTNYTVGLNSADPFQEVIASPGSKLTHIRWGCGRLLWWKDQSFGYTDFDDQYNVSNKIVSDTIGTFDNTSAIDPGGSVWFRGQDGHTWRYDCSFLTKESIDITPNIQASGKRVANSWNQTSDSDFASGSLVAVSTSISNGNVVLSRLDDSFSSLSNWTPTSSTWSVSGGVVNQSRTPIVATTAGMVSKNISSFPGNWRLYMSAKLASAGSSAYGELYAVDASTQANGYGIRLADTSGVKTISIMKGPGTGNTLADVVYPFDNSYHTIELNHATNGVMTLYVDGISTASATDTSYTTFSKGYMEGFSINPLLNVVQFNRALITSSTGTLYSSIKNAPNLTTWSTFGVNDSLNEGTISFFLRSSTNAFTVLSSTPAWTAQSVGSLIGISTGTYFQARADFAVTSATQNPTLNDFTVNWFEGTATDQAYMLYFDNAIWESVAFGSGQSTNNYIFKRDLINDGWLLYNFGAGGLLVQSNRLYFGDTSAGNVFNYGTSTSDNGTAINAFWRSKTFTGNDPFLQNQLTQIDTFAKKDQGTTLTGTYTLDTSTATSYSISLSTPNAFTQSRKPLPSGKLGYGFDFKIGDTSASSNWEVLGYRMIFNPLSYRPTN